MELYIAQMLPSSSTQREVLWSSLVRSLRSIRFPSRRSMRSAIPRTHARPTRGSETEFVRCSLLGIGPTLLRSAGSYCTSDDALRA
jgi:hypothetical protein